MLGLVVAAQGWFLVELLRQHGRILRRLDALEGVPAEAGGPHPLARDVPRRGDGAPSANGNGHGQGPGRRHRLEVLPTRRPSRVARFVAGAGRASAVGVQRPGMRAVQRLAAGGIGGQHRVSDRLTIALISRGSTAQNQATAREHSVANVLVQENREVWSAYQAHGTPSAVLVSPDGRIGSWMAQGAVAIRELVEGATGGVPRQSLAEPNRSTMIDRSRRSPNLHRWKPGARPQRRTLDGSHIALSQLRGSTVVLVFWNPDCGYCQRILHGPCKAWERRRPAGTTRLVLVSTGNREQPRNGFGVSDPA